MKRFLKSFVYAFKGIAKGFEERNMQVHGVAALFAFAVSFVLNLERLEWALIFLCIGTVFAAELINSAIETTLDIVCPHFHPGVQKAKDMAAGAVLVLACTSVGVAFCVWSSAFQRGM